MSDLSSSAPERITSRTLTRVGQGTPMGGFMRQYWIPALMSRELERDGDPIRLLLLGEKLIAFRDTDGKPGVLDERCPHRGVSLFLAATRDRASGASITAGSSPPTASVSTCRTCRPRRTANT